VVLHSIDSADEVLTAMSLLATPIVNNLTKLSEIDRIVCLSLNDSYLNFRVVLK
jgi:hypothetical protein